MAKGIWRRGRDSNPRYGFTPYNGLANPSRQDPNPFEEALKRRNAGLPETRKARQERRRAELARARESAQYDPRSGRPNKSLEEILSQYVVMPSGCHEWTGTRNQYGYGMVCVMIDGKANTMPAHRLQWCRLKGKPTPGMDTCHTCDNRACINIDHLFEGTPKDNIHDMIRKGRHNFRSLKYAGDTAQESARLKIATLDAMKAPSHD